MTEPGEVGERRWYIGLTESGRSHISATLGPGKFETPPEWPLPLGNGTLLYPVSEGIAEAWIGTNDEEDDEFNEDYNEQAPGRQRLAVADLVGTARATVVPVSELADGAGHRPGLERPPVEG